MEPATTPNIQSRDNISATQSTRSWRPAVDGALAVGFFGLSGAAFAPVLLSHTFSLFAFEGYSALSFFCMAMGVERWFSRQTELRRDEYIALPRPSIEVTQEPQSPGDEPSLKVATQFRMEPLRATSSVVSLQEGEQIWRTFLGEAPQTQPAGSVTPLPLTREPSGVEIARNFFGPANESDQWLLSLVSSDSSHSPVQAKSNRLEEVTQNYFRAVMSSSSSVWGAQVTS